MKKLLIILILVISMGILNAMDDRFLYPLGAVKNALAYNIDVVEGQVMVHNQNQIWLYSTFNAWQPRIEASFSSIFAIEDVNLQSGNYIYVSSPEPTNALVPVDSLNQYGKIFFTRTVIGDKLTREGPTLYVADRQRGIDIINVGKGGMQELLANFSEKWGILDFVAEYPYIYALNDFGLVTVDMTDQNFPISLSTNYQILDAVKLIKYGDNLYIAAGKNLLVMSVRDVNKPTLISQFRLSNEIQAMAVNDNRLFLALGLGGVKILDIANPSRPEDINTFLPPFPVYDVAVENTYIYVAMGKDGWMIYEYK